MRGFVAAAALVVLAACKDDDVDWIEFNKTGQTIVVEVLPEGSPEGEPITLELKSNLDLTVVGDATVDPGSGPVGTLHQVAVILDDEYEALVGRVTVDVQSQA